jgi:hypothetical protein
MPAAAAEALTAAYQRQQHAIVLDITRQVSGLWREVDPRAIDRTWPIVSRAVAQTIEQGYASSTAQAVAYMRAHADASHVDLAGQVLAAQRIDPDQLETAMRVTGPVALKSATGAGMSPEQAAQVAVVRLSGSAGRLALLGGRNTIAQTVAASDKIVGWRRVIGGRACFWCAMLASRGAVYKTEQTATFQGASGHKYHDHCACLPEPLYEHEQEPPEVEALRQQFATAAAGHSGSEAIAAFRKGYDPATGAALVEARAAEGTAAVAAAQAAAQAAELVNLSDDDLAARLATADEAEIDRVLAELERRDAVAAADREAAAKKAAAQERRDAKRAAETGAKDAELDRLLAEGMDAEEAYSEAYGISIEKMRRTSAIASLREQGYAGVNFERLSSAAYHDEVDRLYFVAEEQTRGAMLSPAGKRAGIDPRSLFKGSEARARKYASEELLQHWDDYGRLTLEDYRASLLGGRMRERTAGETWRQ